MRPPAGRFAPGGPAARYRAACGKVEGVARAKARTKRVKARPAASPIDPAAAWRRVRLALRDHGLLLQVDATLPNVAALVVGAPVQGSWWSHPAGRAIYATTMQLAGHPDALAAKLVDGKTTWLHRRLWPALLAVATSGEPWQTARLSPAARALRARLLRDGELPAHGDAARELQARLLALGEEQHTPSGRHAVRLLTWERWAVRDVLQPPAMAPAHGQLVLEEALRALGGEAAIARLPWRAAQGRARRSRQASTPARGSRRAARGA